MTLKGLPNEYKPFVTVVTQYETAFTFQKYKQSLRNFEEMEKTRANRQSDDNSVMKITHNFKGKLKFVCFKCGAEGHKANNCRKVKDNKRCDVDIANPILIQMQLVENEIK